MAYTFADIRERIGRKFGGYRKITATGGTTTTIISTSHLFGPNDWWNNFIAYVREDAGGAGAAPEGEYRVVTDYVLSTQTITVSPAFTAAPATGDIIELYPAQLMPPELDSLLEDAIKTANGMWFKPVFDTSSIDLASNDYDYDLPTDCEKLASVWIRAGSSHRWKPFRHWRVEGQPGALDLLIDSAPSSSAQIMICYHSTLDWAGSGDDRTLNIALSGQESKHEMHCVDWLVSYCIEQLYEQFMLRSDDENRNMYWNLLRLMRDERKDIEKRRRMPSLPGQMTVPGWQWHDYANRHGYFSEFSKDVGTNPAEAG